MLQAVAYSAYLNYFFFPGLLGIAGCCTLGGVRVVSAGFGSFDLVPLSQYLCEVALLPHRPYFFDHLALCSRRGHVCTKSLIDTGYLGAGRTANERLGRVDCLRSSYCLAQTATTKRSRPATGP